MRPRFNAVEASELQKLYRTQKKIAFQQIMGGESPFCQLEPEVIQTHFREVFGEQGYEWRDPPAIIPNLDQEVGGNDVLLRSITADEVAKRLRSCKNTAPGPDYIKYRDLKTLDPEGALLSDIFNICWDNKRIPQTWKESRTVLIYKKGDREDLSNWRPLTLGGTMSKLYAGVVADRIAQWAKENQIISPMQKGFMEFEGCLEHNFTLQQMLDNTRRTRNSELCLAWLDLANAFGSVPHAHIQGTLREFKMPEEIQDIVADMYRGAATRVRTREGYTDLIEMKAGVKQGCPLSPILFNLAMEPIVRAITARAEPLGTLLYGRRIGILAYADDIVLSARNIGAMEEMLRVVSEAATWSGLRFKPAKCATLHIAWATVTPTVFRIQGEEVKALAEGEHYQHLGVPTGVRIAQTPTTEVDKMIDDLEKVHTSLLAPWQKIDAVRTFLLPRLEFIMRGGAMKKTLLKPFDIEVKRKVKLWMSLPARASPEVVFLPTNEGGAGILPLGDSADVLAVTHPFRLLHSKDDFCRGIAEEALQDVVSRKMTRRATPQDCCAYLSGSEEGVFGRADGQISSIWTQARTASRRLSKRIGCQGDLWEYREDQGGFFLRIPLPGRGVNEAILGPRNRGLAAKMMRTSIRINYKTKLLAKPDQGKAWTLTSKWDSSNHFLREGKFTRFADWRFIHRARLDCVPLNGTKRFGQGAKACRICGYQSETLPHVLGHCWHHSTAIQHRHNGIQDRLVKAIPSRIKNLGAIQVNKRTPDNIDQLRPDIILRNERDRKVHIIDITCPFENGPDAFVGARNHKLAKYRATADGFRAQGYETTVDSFIVGALGGWDPANEGVLRALSIAPRYASKMRGLMVSDTIKWSRDIYVEHVTGRRQY